MMRTEMVLLAALFAYWAAASASIVIKPSAAASVSSSSPLVEEEGLTTRLGYKEIRFSTNGATEATYAQLLKEIRNHTAAEGDVRHRVQVMRDPATVPESSELLFLLVVVSNRRGLSVTLALKVTDLCLEAYRVGNRSFFFRNSAPNSVFADATSSYTLPYGSNSYDDLEREAGGVTRGSIDLGMTSLDEAVTSLSSSSSFSVMDDQNSNQLRARSLLVVIQMVSEAARFWYIQSMMGARIRTGVPSPPDSAILSLENNWGQLSAAIQNANDAGVFPDSIALQNSRSEPLLVDNVNMIAPYVAIISYVCHRSRNTTTTSSSSSSPQMLIRPVVIADAAHELIREQETCTASSTKTRIVGLNGLCVDSCRSSYCYLNGVRWLPCKVDDDYADQLWTLESNGTIRSEQYCLVKMWHVPIITTVDCSREAATSASNSRWQVSDDGTTVANVDLGGQVMSAFTLAPQEFTLYLDANRSSLAQSWRFTNIVEPRVTSIVGLRGLCLHANGSRVWVEECVDGKVEQKWALYADGSIRPEGNQWRNQDFYLRGALYLNFF